MKKHVLTLLVGAGLIAGCSQSVETASQDFNQLPPAVQKTVRAQAPNGEIARVTHKTQNGADAYQIEFRREGGTNPEMLVAADGTVLNSDFPSPPGMLRKALTPTGAVGTPLSALPEAVQKTIQAQAPNAQISKISRHDENGRTVYEVGFSEPGKNPTIQVAEDGTLVQNLQK